MYQAPLGNMAKERLATMRQTTDGFVIAQKDLNSEALANCSAHGKAVRRSFACRPCAGSGAVARGAVHRR